MCVWGSYYLRQRLVWQSHAHCPQLSWVSGIPADEIMSLDFIILKELIIFPLTHLVSESRCCHPNDCIEGIVLFRWLHQDSMTQYIITHLVFGRPLLALLATQLSSPNFGSLLLDDQNQIFRAQDGNLFN